VETEADIKEKEKPQPRTEDFNLESSGGFCEDLDGKTRKAGEIWAWENLGCGCACLEGKDHCGRLDVDCNCGGGIGAKNETGQKLLLWAKKLKSKYSKEKARANRRNKKGFQKGPDAPCVGDENPNTITTKLWKAGETWKESVLLSCNLCGYRCKCDHGVKTCECPFDNNTLKMEDCRIDHDDIDHDDSNWSGSARYKIPLT